MPASRWQVPPCCPQPRPPPACGSLTSCARCPSWLTPVPFPPPGGTRRALEIAGITADSRRVAPGYLFAALPGSRADGRAFIADAVSRGAVAVLAPRGHRVAAGRAAAAAAGGSRAAPPPRPARRRPGRQPAARRGRGHRHQRQDQHGRVPAPDLGRGRQAGGQPRHARPDRAGVRSRSRPDHARSGQPGGDAGAARARRHPACRDGGLVARPRPVPPGRRAPGGRGVHQPDARSPRLSRLGGRLPRRQAAAVRRAAAGRCAGRGEQRDGCGDARGADRDCGAAAARSAHGRRGRIGDPRCWRPNRVPTAGPAHRGGRRPARDRAAAAGPLPGRQCPDGRGAGRRARRARCAGSAGVAARRARPAGAGGAPAERRRGLCRLRAHAGCAGAAADRAAPAHRGPAARGVRRRRRPRPRQASADGRGRGAPCRCRHRHRRQSAQRGPGRDPRRRAGRLSRWARDRRSGDAPSPRR